MSQFEDVWREVRLHSPSVNFSSGLVLYFLFSNVMSIGEQKLFRMLGARDRKTAVEVIAAEDGVGNGGKKKRLPKKDR